MLSLPATLLACSPCCPPLLQAERPGTRELDATGKLVMPGELQRQAGPLVSCCCCCCCVDRGLAEAPTGCLDDAVAVCAAGGIDPHTHLAMPFMGQVACDDFYRWAGGEGAEQTEQRQQRSLWAAWQAPAQAQPVGGMAGAGAGAAALGAAAGEQQAPSSCRLAPMATPSRSGHAAALAGGTTMHIDFALPIDHDLLAGWEEWRNKAQARWLAGCWG